MTADERLLRRAAVVIAVQAAVAVAVLVAVIAVLVLSLTVRSQHTDSARIVRDAAIALRSDGDADNAPPGVALLVREPNGQLRLSPGAGPELANLDVDSLPRGLSILRVAGGRSFQLFTSDRGDHRVVAAMDLGAGARERNRLLTSLLVAGALGIAAAGALGWVIARRAVRPLGAALALQRRFVADASHELRTPLTILHTRAQLLLRRARGDDPHRAELDRLVHDTRALTEIVNDLLLSAEMEHRPEARSTVDVGTLARDVADGFGLTASEAQVTLTVEAAEGLTVSGVPAALRRAIGALVDNALGHSSAGGAVLIRVTRHESTVVLSVHDNGSGLDPTQAAQLTERFARGSDAAGSGRRFGLGLALVREVVHAHGGTLSLDGAPGQGAVATIVLPAA